MATSLSLIDGLQLDASKPAVSVSGLLRKALMVAAKLELADTDIPEWINKELSGYSGDDSLPSYRIVHGTVKARSLRGWVPVQFPTNDMQDKVSEKFISNSLAEIEALIKRDGELMFGFPTEAHQFLQEIFQYETEFTCFIEKTRLDGILDEIRNRVLRWAIALDKAGIRGDGLSFTGAEKEKAHSMVFHADSGSLNIGVVGNVAGQANVATGFQPRAGSIDAGDIQKLIAEIGTHITSLHLLPADKHELLTALAELESTNPTKPIETGKVRQVLNRALGLIGKADESVVTAGIKAYTEAWMKQHGIAP